MSQEQLTPLQSAVLHFDNRLRNSEEIREQARTSYELARSAIEKNGKADYPGHAPRVVGSPLDSRVMGVRMGVHFIDTPSVELSVLDRKYNIFLREHHVLSGEGRWSGVDPTRPGVEMLIVSGNEDVARLFCTFQEEQTLNQDGSILDMGGTKDAYQVLNDFNNILTMQQVAASPRGEVQSSTLQ